MGSLRLARAAILLSGCVMTAACSGTEGASTTIAAARDTIDGVPRVLYPATGEASLAWEADTVAVIGDVLGDDPDYQFDQVTPNGLASDEAGNVWLLDPAGHRVVGYGPDGRFLASHGRKGDGPGEINMAFALTAGPADTLWVLESMSRRLTGFPAAGGEPRVVSFEGSIVPAAPVVMRPDAILSGVMFMFSPGREPEDTERRFVLARFERDGTMRDTLFSMPMPKQDVVQVEAGNRRMMMMSTPQFSPVLRWAAFSDGTVAVASDDRYVIRLIGPDGAERLRIEREGEPRPVTDADREAVRERMRGQQSRIFGGDPALAEELQRRQLEAMTFAATVPRIERLAVDRQDRLWVRAAPDEPDGAGRIDVYDRDGELLGSIAELDLPTVFLRDGMAAYLGKDEDTDVQQVAVVRLSEGPAGRR